MAAHRRFRRGQRRTSPLQPVMPQPGPACGFERRVHALQIGHRHPGRLDAQLGRLDPLHAPKGTVEPGEKRTADHCQERQRNHRLQEREAFLPRRHQRIVPGAQRGLKQQRMCRAPMMDLQLSAQANSVCHVTYRRPSSNRPAIGQSQQLLGNRPALTNEQLPPIAAHAIAQGLQLIEQIVQRGPARPGLLHPHQAGQRHRSNGPDDHQHHQQFEQGERGLVNVWARNRHRHPGLSHRAAHPRPGCRE